MKSLSKNVYVNKFANIANKNNNTQHSAIKMNPFDVKTSKHFNFGMGNNDKDPKFKIYDHGRITKNKNYFAKGYASIWSEVGFVIKKVKNTVSWKYVISDLNGDKIVELFYEKGSQKPNQKDFKVEKVTKKKGSKLYLKCEGCDIFLTVLLIKKISLYKMSYFPEPYILIVKTK